MKPQPVSFSSQENWNQTSQFDPVSRETDKKKEGFHLKPKSCKVINATFRQRLLVYFKIVWDNQPKHLTFHFGELGDMGEQNYDIVGEGDIGNSVSIDELRDIFSAEDYKNDNDPEKLNCWLNYRKIFQRKHTQTLILVRHSYSVIWCN